MFCAIIIHSEGEIKTCSEKQNSREFVASRLSLQEILKVILWREGEPYRSETQIYIKKGEHRRRNK